MTRPAMVRADTIDVQDHSAPSAKDHPSHHHLPESHLPESASGHSAAPIAPHQAETLREVAHETAEEEARGPRVSWTNGKGCGTGAVLQPYAGDSDDDDHRPSSGAGLSRDLAGGTNGSDMYRHDHQQQQQDALAVAQNGGVSSSDEGDLDGDGDTDLEDDMMDKISSSPSIEDGGCNPVAAPVAWPRRVSSLPSFLRDLCPVTKAPSAIQAMPSKSGPAEPPLPVPRTSVHLQQMGIAAAEWQCNRHLPRGEYADWHNGDFDDGHDGYHDRHDVNRFSNDRGISGGVQRNHRTSTIAAEPDARKRGLCVELGPPSEERGVGGRLAGHGTIDDDEYGGYTSGGLPLTFPYEPSFEEDDDSDYSLPDELSYLESEDIDFEFVYALHTFVATVEGQANATKGDTMVLLDDSNSYWWLVRVVKDSSIGYLPAEHIETPTERLARLNKHRNIDLSATMLGDQTAKQKNSFKGIRRRRKTVTFADPTYVDYSDFDYSTDEEDIEELFGPHPTTAQQQREPQKQERQQSAPTEDEATDESAKVEPLKTRAISQDTVAESAKEEPAGQEEIRGSDELIENKPDGPSRSRNGTVRNTDSFFKDESVETKKISLTPNLLRDDNTPRESTESVTRDLKSRTSLDKLDKELVSDKERKKSKDKDKKDKDKKPSAIRSFFSRKDKKKAAEDDDESFGKRSMDMISESRDSEDRAVDEQPSSDKPGAQRNPGKLQKASLAGKAPGGTAQKSVELASYLAEGRNNDVSNVPPASMRIVDPESRETQEVPPDQRKQTHEATRERSSSAAAQREEKSVISKITPTRSASTGQDPKLQKTVKAKARMELDASDSSEVEEPVTDQGQQTPHEASTEEQNGERGGEREISTGPQLPGTFPDSYEPTSTISSDKTVTPQHPQQNPMERAHIPPTQTSPLNTSDPPALVVDTSSPEGNSPEASPSPDQVHTMADSQRGGSSASKEPSWDDTKLRAFFDETDHIRDLLAVVYDKSNVEPAGSDHPIVGGLFREQNAKLAEITTQLDNMLGDWLARKQRLRGTI
ncbi:NAD-specific glutamate dehydrogenase [Tolypocladium paradoxum]|uniref:NAD-specific glutamate dehydrogenase n=1 Tax=Tolypocladium paradoxum TaxID=94208 RepID=A0A2S4KS60_9HYPO|nr:NAD-specific glutamate dehydrogenase [Tolypocladium paradoxum]